MIWKDVKIFYKHNRWTKWICFLPLRSERRYGFQTQHARTGFYSRATTNDCKYVEFVPDGVRHLRMVQLTRHKEDPHPPQR
eukprot:5908195-Amphidinium_carterae.1